MKPSVAAATNGAPTNEWVIPRWCWRFSIWPAQRPQHVKVGGFGGEHHGQRGQRALAIKSGATHAGAGQEVGNRLQWSPRKMIDYFDTLRRVVPVPGLSCQQIHGVWQNLHHGLQRIHRAGGAPGKVQNQRATAHSADPTAENREFGVSPARRRAFFRRCRRSVSSTLPG